MSLKDRLDIVLVTYNRKDFLAKTLEQIFSDNSPIKNLDITILNNNSTDGSTELINEYCQRFPNINHIINKINIGGNANIAKAFAEHMDKDYIWILCDNDTYDWTTWNEIENAINDNYDVIVTRNCKNKSSEIFHEANFVPACIYKTKNITSTVIENIYDNIRFLFPHLAVIAKNINDNKNFFVVSKNIVNIGVNPDLQRTYNKDRNLKDVPKSRRMMFWSVGFLNSIELITDRKKQIEIIDDLKHFHENLFEFFMSVIIYNQLFEESYSYNIEQILKVLNFRQKIKFVLAYITVKISLKNYKYWFIRYSDEWIEYLKTVNEQKYIDNLSKQLKNKKVLLYGAGMFANILFKNYDLSKLNFAGISDKKFENTNDEYFRNIKIIKPKNIKNTEFDVILFTLKEYKKIEKHFKENGINKKCYSLIKISNKYALRV